MNVILGTTESHTDLQIGDIERRNGLYILGKPRMGKSWLMVSLALQDIDNGNGLFFLDPHGDAISDIFARMTWFIIPNQYYLLNPEDTDYTFGINLLECKDIKNQHARSATFARAKGVFDKLWKSTFEERPWLQLILHNSLYAFIENQGYTLAELPLFFRDREFRNFIVNNIKYNTQVRDYWLKTFASKSKHDQDNQMEAAQTRAEIMLGHPYVRDIVGQTKTTIDFEALMEKRARIFVKLSSSLPHEPKKIIGTILISELLHAIERRPPDKRNQFCIFVDEFQTFAAYQDFSTLITQAPKYGIATTLAHHDRYGQLGDDKPIIGATAAIANKVLFQVTGKDAHDFAPEFAKQPTVETRFEDQLVISQNPFWDLLYGHSNPEVRSFIEKYLRPIKERLEDIHGEARAESLMRMEYLDTANLYRLDERLEGVNIASPSPDVQRGLLHSAGRSIQKARSQAEKLQILNEESQTLRRLIRSLNKLFIAVMEGKVSPYSSDFRKALVEQVKYFDLIDILEPLYHIHCLIIQGEDRADELTNPRTAGKYNYLSEKDSEFKYPSVYKSFKHEEGRAFERTLYDFITDLGETDIERMETLTKKRFQEALQIHKKHVPVTRAPYAQRWNALHHNIKIILEPLCDLKAVCVLLQKPENHLRVRSNQQTEKQVPTRTVADMVNEMEGELTELPKYTAYAKVLQGEKVWRGKILAKKLGERQHYALCTEWEKGEFMTGSYEDINYSNLTAVTRKYVCLKREEIEREIRERQENWKPTAVGEPRVVRDKNEKGPAGPADKPVVEPDGPPPPSRPKPRR